MVFREYLIIFLKLFTFTLIALSLNYGVIVIFYKLKNWAVFLLTIGYDRLRLCAILLCANGAIVLNNWD